MHLLIEINGQPQLSRQHKMQIAESIAEIMKDWFSHDIVYSPPAQNGSGTALSH